MQIVWELVAGYSTAIWFGSWLMYKLVQLDPINFNIKTKVCGR